MDAIAQQLVKFPLEFGSHRDSDAGLCVMECVAFVAGVPHTDHPRCACLVITEVATHINDNGGDDIRRALASRILRLAGSRGDYEVTAKRACFLVNFVLKTLLPQALLTFGDADSTALAQAFKALVPITCPPDLQPARTLLAKLPRKVNFGSKHLTSGEEIRDMLERVLVALADRQCRVVAFRITDLFVDMGVEVDYLALIDALLDIGGTPALDITPEVASRITTLAGRESTPA